MTKFNDMLVPIDDSSRSDIVFEKALQMARNIKSSITLVEVIPPETKSHGGKNSSPDAQMYREAYKRLQRYRNKVKDDKLKIETMIKYGPPSKTLIRLSREYDMIVMGKSKYNPLSPSILDSVAENVLNESHCPVMLVGNYEN
ncbi:MAG: universal stress protein [Thermoplasmatota archaeon]